jgi:hypothetical protein
MFLPDKRKKIGNKIQKNRSPKKLKKKEDSKKPKKDGFLQKHRIEEPTIRETLQKP